MEIITKEYAKIFNLKFYFTGLPCKNNHLDKRYLNTGICYQCKRDIQHRDYNKNKERVSTTNHKSYLKNRDRHLEKSKLWSTTNKSKSNQIKKNYKLRNLDKVRESARLYQKLCRQDSGKRLSKNLSKSIWECLKSKKAKRSWKSLVNFTLDDLINHLQNKFKDGMTWENYGKYWHVDHITPLSWFNLEQEFDKAWDLNNLQPLEASLNLSKNNKYKG